MKAIQAGRPSVLDARWLLAALIIVAGWLPIGLVHYPALYDYAPHLLEAQVVLHYGDPVRASPDEYQLRADWPLRSNALGTLLMVGLGGVVPLEWAGRLTLALYVFLFIGGMAWILALAGQPAWLLWGAALLLYNLTFTSGMINWSLGLSLLPWLIGCYWKWETRPNVWAWASMAGLSLVIYTAHALAWGLGLVVIGGLAATAPRTWRFTALTWAALAAATPLLVMTRPALIAALVVLAAGWVAVAWLQSRVGLGRMTLGAAGGVVLALAGIRLTRPAWQTAWPDTDYSLYGKWTALFRTFTLPQHGLPVLGEQVLVNVGLLIGLGGLAGWWAYLSWRDRKLAAGGRGPGQARWALVLLALAAVFWLVPSRTTDIVVTEPRVLLVCAIVALTMVRLPANVQRAAAGILTGLGLFSIAVALGHALTYEARAQRWSQVLARIPPGQAVLVLSNLPDVPTTGWQNAARLAQVLDDSQFSSWYALESGGFVSNVFFNGPLQAMRPESIPPYWWAAFEPGAYLAERCDRLRSVYPYLVVWQPVAGGLMDAAHSCYGSLLIEDPDLTVWTWSETGREEPAGE